jgi:superoxide oxidase
VNAARLPMQNSGVIQRPNAGSVVLHWLGAALVFLALLAGLFAVYYSSGCCAADHRIAYLLHAYAGLAVLGLVVMRLMFRARYSWPDPTKPGKTGLGDVVAKVIHWTFYGLMILIPLTGWIMASGMGCCWYVPGMPNVNLLSFGIGSTTRADVGTAYQVHVSLAWIIIGLISLHVAAALFHHVFLKEDVLQRMLPGRIPPKATQNDGLGKATPAPMNKEDI